MTFYLTGEEEIDNRIEFHLDGIVNPDTGFEFHLDGEEEEKPWKLIAKLMVDSVDWGDTTGSPGNYTGYDGNIKTDYGEIKVVGTEGAWTDGSGNYPPDGGWRAFIGCCTELDCGIVGVFKSFGYDEQAARNAFSGASAIYRVGDDRKFYWGVPDIAGNNSGKMHFNIYGR